MITLEAGHCYSYILSACFVIVGCTIYDFTRPQQASWEWLGDVAIGVPIEENNGLVLIPVEFDPSHYQMRNSMPRSFHGIKSEVQDDAVHFSVTFVNGKLSKEPLRAIKLQPPRSGTYEFFYRDPDGTLHSVGTAFLKSTPSHPASPVSSSRIAH